ncbi:MAG: hypothetical protein QOG83_1998 [Alphaproteobacteria bacterium]|jgi:hypothetical protein|nr:hypothetical protein [Alphaproteobacteria bacterium]MEA2989287.1 hypothetical protein [Alphaproteobacteria bacterium]
MNPAPQLSDMEQRLLSAILTHPNIGGAELMRYAGVSRSEDLIQPVRKLQANNLIEVSGDVFNEKMLPYATFGYRPSAKEYLHFVLQQQSV